MSKMQIPTFDAQAAAPVAAPADSAEAIFQQQAEARAARNTNREQPETEPEMEPEIHENIESEERSAQPDKPEPEEPAAPREEAPPIVAPPPPSKPRRPAQPRLTPQQQAQLAELQTIQEMANENPAIAQEYAKALRAKGRPVPPDLEAFLARVAAPAAATPIAPPESQQLTKEQITAKFRQIMKTGDVEAAYEFKADQMFGLKLRTLEAEVLADKQRRQTEQRQYDEQQYTRQVNDGLTELAGKYTDFFEVINGVPDFKDTDEATQLRAKMIELDEGYQRSLDVRKLARLALDELGWLGRNPQRDAAAPAKPATPARKPVNERAQMQAQREREGRERDTGRSANGRFKKGIWGIQIPVYDRNAQRR